MREDTIVFEDWKIGRSLYSNPTSLIRWNYALTIIFAIVQLYIGTIEQSGVTIFAWVFTVLIAGFIEGILDQYSRSILNQIVFVFSLVYLSILVFPNSNFDSSFVILVHIIGGIIITMKLIVIYLLYLKLHFTENVLVPRSNNASSIYEEQLLRVQFTEYEIATPSNFGVSLKAYIKPFKTKFFIIALTIFLFVSILTIFYPSIASVIIYFVGIGISIVCSLYLLTLLIVWWQNKRKLRQKKNEESIDNKPITLFPSINE